MLIVVPPVFLLLPPLSVLLVMSLLTIRAMDLEIRGLILAVLVGAEECLSSRVLVGMEIAC